VTSTEPTADDTFATSDASSDVGQPRLSVMTWNLEWFQDPTQGPTDDAAQYNAVEEILESSGMSLVALQEVASELAFERLLRALPRYAGALSGYAWTQKTALLWDADRLELMSVHAIEGLDDAGRPPLEVRLRDKRDGRDLLVVVVHAKAQADAQSYDKRSHLAQGLKTHLDIEHPRTPLILLGDFNDLLIGSLTAGADTPYRLFLDDPAYAAPTRALDQPTAAETSFAWGATVDHVLVSDELAARVVPGSVEVLRDELLARYPDYTSSVSDHFPVTLAIAW
jgi:endonuclease/exonuclease/phosphatase family metal-dependent hydrolase